MPDIVSVSPIHNSQSETEERPNITESQFRVFKQLRNQVFVFFRVKGGECGPNRDTTRHWAPLKLRINPRMLGLSVFVPLLPEQPWQTYPKKHAEHFSTLLGSSGPKMEDRNHFQLLLNTGI
ncbi:hypothetical protein V2G26_004588 [Clonostachys chloroleuca]